MTTQISNEDLSWLMVKRLGKQLGIIDIEDGDDIEPQNDFVFDPTFGDEMLAVFVSSSERAPMPDFPFPILTGPVAVTAIFIARGNDLRCVLKTYCGPNDCRCSTISTHEVVTDDKFATTCASIAIYLSTVQMESDPNNTELISSPLTQRGWKICRAINKTHTRKYNLFTETKDTTFDGDPPPDNFVGHIPGEIWDAFDDFEPIRAFRLAYKKLQNL